MLLSPKYIIDISIENIQYKIYFGLWTNKVNIFWTHCLVCVFDIYEEFQFERFNLSLSFSFSIRSVQFSRFAFYRRFFLFSIRLIAQMLCFQCSAFGRSNYFVLTFIHMLGYNKIIRRWYNYFHFTYSIFNLFRYCIL